MARLTGPGDRLRGETALVAFGATFLLFLLAGFVLPANPAGMIVRQIGFLAVPAVVAVRVARVPWRAGLGLGAPRLAGVLGAVLVGVSFWYLVAWAVLPVLDLLVRDPERLAEMERHVAWADASPWLRVLAVAAIPALCEELLCRGVLGRALVPMVGFASAVALSAILFALLHLQAARMLPAAVLGGALGFAALAQDGIACAALIHFLHNLIVVVVLPAEIAQPAVHGMEGHPHLTGVAALALSAVGFFLLRRGDPVAPSREPDTP
jgi:membrane protease YdiL (CAAX protease family)